MTKDAYQIADDYNAKHSVGRDVYVLKDNRKSVATKTRSEAWVLAKQPVIMLEGISGCYLLSRVYGYDPIAPPSPNQSKGE